MLKRFVIIYVCACVYYTSSCVLKFCCMHFQMQLYEQLFLLALCKKVNGSQCTYSNPFDPVFWFLKVSVDNSKVAKIIHQNIDSLQILEVIHIFTIVWSSNSDSSYHQIKSL